MAMDKINGSPLLRQSILDRFRGTERSGSGAAASGGAAADGIAGATTDKAEISDAAHRLVDLKQAVDVGRRAVAALPDPRPEMVAAARERLATGFYHSVEVRQTVADRVAGVINSLDNL
jgi:hypothetical protein